MQKIKIPYVTIIGAGLAGSEAAYQLAIRGVPVHLFEMRPEKKRLFIPLVCRRSWFAATLSVP